MYQVVEEMPYDGGYIIKQFGDLEEARKFARKVDNNTCLEYKKMDRESTIHVRQEYDF